MNDIPRDEPVFQISVVARMIGVHQQTLRAWERLDFVVPRRSAGNRRLYSRGDIEVLRQLRRYVEDFGVNPAGAAMMLRLNRSIGQLQRELAEARAEIARLRAAREAPAPGGGREW